MWTIEEWIAAVKWWRETFPGRQMPRWARDLDYALYAQGLQVRGVERDCPLRLVFCPL
jgi:hypothetical protein